MRLIRPSVSTNRVLLSALIFILCSAVPLYATTIEFVATNLVDTTPGQDLWRYDYIASGGPFLQSSFFDIFFDPLLFGSLTAGPAPNPDWDVAILQQPNPINLPPFNSGIFDSFALVDNASLAGLFSVSFTYLGTGTPGAQMFEVYDADSVLRESGLTSRLTVPEPSPLLLSAVGVVLLVMRFQFCRASKI